MIKYKSLFLFLFVFLSSTVYAGSVSTLIYDSGKNVGIGTTNPISKLHIRQSSNEDWAAYIQNGGGAGKGLLVEAAAGGQTPIFQANDGYGHVRFVILSNGNTGIGTNTSPVSKLDLGTNYSDPGSYPNKITLWNGGENNYFGFGISASDLDYFSQHNHRFYTQFNGSPGSEKMVISSAGDVAIGAQPVNGYKLTVNGGIYALDLRIKPDLSNTADFVFEEGYDLMPLNEVKATIKKNHHLPGVPSAEDMVKNGVSVAEMQATLLKKIEELTLYMISQDEKIESQSKEIQLLNNQINPKKIASVY